jgi:hypothetical protein
METQLKIAINLTVKTSKYDFVGRPIKKFQASLEPHGFEGKLTLELTIDRENEAFFADFLSDEIIDVSISIEPVYQTQGRQVVKPIKIKGIVTTRAFSEQEYQQEQKKQSLSSRTYEMSFVDPASYYWKRHFPIELYTKKTTTEVIKAHAFSKLVNLSITHPAMDVNHPQIFLALGESKASFWDYMQWIASETGGLVDYDYEEQKYIFLADKPVIDKPDPLPRPDIESLQIKMYQSVRSTVRIKNSFAEASSVSPIDNKLEPDTLYDDRLTRTAVPAEVDVLKNKISAVATERMPTLHTTFNLFPHYVIYPGSGYKLRKGEWSAKRYGIDATYRCTKLDINAVMSGGDANIVSESTADSLYSCDYQATWEDATESAIIRPSFEQPVFPRAIEGTIYTESGQEEDRVYEFKLDEATQRQTYQIKVPLWSSEGGEGASGESIVEAPFEPNYLPGFSYLPHYRDERVLINVYYGRAEIVRSLEWGATVQPPQDGQGQNLLFGKNATSQTGVTHVYEDNKPVFTVARTDQGDLQTLTMSENTMILEVKQGESDESEAKE